MVVKWGFSLVAEKDSKKDLNWAERLVYYLAASMALRTVFETAVSWVALMAL
jgi:hypothetical protein